MINYGTVEEIRKETGLLGDPSVNDEVIKNYLDQATGVVITYASSTYEVNQLKPGEINIDSPTFEYLKRAEALLASGYLLIKLYGGDFDGDKNGYEKVKEGKSLFNLVNSKEMHLIDEEGKEYKKVKAIPIVTQRFGINVSNFKNLKHYLGVGDKY